MTIYQSTTEGEAFHDALESVSHGRAQQDVFDGREFSTGALFEGVADGSSVNVWLENPSGSGVVVVATTRIATNAQFNWQKVDSVTVDTAGTAIDSENRLLSDGTENSNVEKNVTYSGGNGWSPKIAGSGGAGATAVGSSDSDIEIAIQPGENFLIEATNASGSSAGCSMDIDYAEIPIDEIEELE